MKKLMLSLAVTISLTASAQTSTTPEGFTGGYFINSSNEKTEGFIKESFKKGTIVFINTDGAKKNYSPADINEFSIDNSHFIAYMNDFYKVITAGKKGTLLQKVTNNSGKMLYNGTEAFSATTTEGKPGDYYLRVKSINQVELVTNKNFEKVFAASCADCTALLSNIQSKQLDYASIEKAVEQYNNCN
jgi:hypothetical protein